MLGGGVRAFEQATKWAQTRFQFQRPLADFELVKAKIARMAALCYAMDALLYQTCGMLDRGDEPGGEAYRDIMLETAICKLFCSEMGWRVVNDAMQIMGGEGYMTENEIERIFRDSRINLIVEGANEVMQSFIFAYGGKHVAEQMLGVRQAVAWDHLSMSRRDRIFPGSCALRAGGDACTAGWAKIVPGRAAAGAGEIRDLHASLETAGGQASVGWFANMRTSSSSPADTTARKSSRASSFRRGWPTARCGCTRGPARSANSIATFGVRPINPAPATRASSAIKRRHSISWKWPSAKSYVVSMSCLIMTMFRRSMRRMQR